MTSFAVVLSDRQVPSDRGIARVQAALFAVHRTTPIVLRRGACTLIVAGACTPGGADFAVDRVGGIAAAGQLVLEDRAALARSLDHDDGARDLALVAAAYRRWGVAFAEHLNGEYAIALWDERNRTLLSARDGLGVRLLYAARGRGVAVVSNVLAAAASHPAVPRDHDERAFVSFLATGEPDHGRTPYAAVRVVPPGHTLRIGISDRGAHLTRHWWFPQARESPPPARDVPDAYRAVVEAATADRLRVPRASILLSGGADSTSIAASARAAVPAVTLHGFTAVYERLPECSEFPLASAAGRMLDFPVEAVVSDHGEPLDALTQSPAVPQLLDEPTLADWRTLLHAAAAHGPVALCGEDGDALFLPPELRNLRREMTPASLVAAAVRYVIGERHLPYLGLRLGERLPGRRVASARTPAWLTPEARALLSEPADPSCFGLRPTPLPPHPTRPRMQARLSEGIPHHLALLIAPEVTGAPLEVRFPLLDTRVVRFVVNVPPIPWCQNKRLPRDAYRGLLPAAVLQRRKTGVAGLHDLLVRSWQRRHAELPPPANAVWRWVDPATWRTALSGADAGSVSDAWRVLQLDAWLAGPHGAADLQEPACTA